MLWRRLKTVETRALLAWMSVAAAAWAFVKLAGEVGEGETAALDRRLLLALRWIREPWPPLPPAHPSEDAISPQPGRAQAGFARCA